jgi:hypothetical protein
MNYDLLPEDVTRYIFTFIFAKCERCNKYCHFSKLRKNCKIFIYKSVFQDDHGFDEVIDSFDIICYDCIKEYTYKGVISFNNYIFKWVKNI